MLSPTGETERRTLALMMAHCKELFSWLYKRLKSKAPRVAVGKERRVMWGSPLSPKDAPPQAV